MGKTMVLNLILPGPSSNLKNAPYKFCFVGKISRLL